MRWRPIVVLLGLSIMGCRTTRGPAAVKTTPPRARVAPVRLEQHGHVREDDYYWLRERENPDVVAYLEAENAYADSVLAHTSRLQQRLFREIKGRIVKNDASVPQRLGDYFYYERYQRGDEYPVYCRRKGAPDAPEEVLLDANELARGQAYFAVSGVAVNSTHDVLAFAVDTVGRRIYTIRFKDLSSGKLLDDAIPEATRNLAWAEDGRTLFYTRQDPETLRWDRVFRHELGSDPAADRLVYSESDETFSCYVFKTKSRRYVMIGAYQTLSAEFRYLDAADPRGEFRVFLPRQREHEYSVDHLGDHFYIRTNWEARNFRLMRTPVEHTDRAHWTEVIPHRADVLLESFDVFREHLVVEERRDGLVRLRVLPQNGAAEHYVEFAEPAYVAWIDDNYELDTTVLRYGYSSMTTPKSIYDHDMATGRTTLLKRDEVLGGFDSANYVTERLYAPARDGERVPVSLVYRRGFARDGTRPLLLYGYGSYGYSLDARFSPERLSLLDRGFVWAIAHVRGGEELGRRWYEDGKLLKKMNTFQDFIDCAEFLVRERYADPQRVFAWGGSAGGLLIGAVVNLRPDLWRGAIAAVPFVDVVTTMLDDTIPLTSEEYDEWGDPHDRTYYDYMLAYSPYDNVAPRDYPSLLVTSGLHDSQVQYWEPAKWVAKLRRANTGAGPILLRTNMEAGHGGVSGRFRKHRETAFEYAFLLDLAGLGG